MAYLQWMWDLYEDNDYVDIHVILSKENLGLHIFKATINNSEKAKNIVKVPKEDCKIASGMAEVLVEDFLKWYATIKDNTEEVIYKGFSQLYP